MKKWLLVLFFIFFLQIASTPARAMKMPTFFADVTPAVQAPSASESESKKEIIVSFKANPTAKTLMDVSRENSTLGAKYGISSSNLMVYTVQEGTPAEAVSNILNNPDVQSAFPNFLMELFTLPNDPAIRATPVPGKPRVQWDMFNLKIADEEEGAWDKTTGSSAITVAVIDSGIDSGHPELSGKTILVDCTTNPCQKVSSMTDNPNPQFVHGTHVAGIVAAATNNAAGMAGAGYNTKIMMVKIMNGAGEISFDNVIRAINYVVDHKSTDNIRVVNMSFGQLEELLDSAAINALHTAIQRADNAGIVIVAAAGNSGAESNSKSYPAAFPEVISVAALGVDNRLASYSEHNDATVGNWIWVAAPGGECTSVSDVYNCIASSVPRALTCSVSVGPLGETGYCYMSGTSQASPHVAAVAAMMLAANSNLSSSQLKQKIQETSNKSLPTDKPAATKYGGVNALAAVLAASPNITPSVTISPSGTPAASVTPSAISPSPTQSLPTPSPNPNARLPKTPPDPYPSPPYCPNPSGCLKKTVGDANCDGFVDDADYKFWKEQFDTIPPGSPADGNANYYCLEQTSLTRFVDMIDFEIWRRNR